MNGHHAAQQQRTSTEQQPAAAASSELERTLERLLQSLLELGICTWRSLSLPQRQSS